MVSSLHSAMTAALLAVRVEVANFYGLIAAILPLNLYIGLVHIVLPSQLTLQQRGFLRPLKETCCMPGNARLLNGDTWNNDTYFR